MENNYVEIRTSLNGNKSGGSWLQNLKVKKVFNFFILHAETIKYFIALLQTIYL